MSYDIYIAGEDFNVTFNISRLFYDHIPDAGKRGGLHELNGLTGKQAVEVLSDAFDRIDRTRCNLWSHSEVGDRRFCAQYDAPNGWGSTVGGLVFLARLMGACARNPRSRVRVSA